MDGLADLKDILPGGRTNVDFDSDVLTDADDLLQLPPSIAGLMRKGSSDRRKRLGDAVDIVRRVVSSNNQGGASNETFYFVASIMSLEQILSGAVAADVAKDKDGTTLTGAMCQIVSTTIQDTSRRVLNLKRKDVLRVLEAALSQNIHDELCCRSYSMSVVSMIAVLDTSSMDAPEVVRSYNQVLALAADERSRVAHRARLALTALHMGPRGRLVAHRYSPHIRDSLVRSLEGADTSRALRAISVGDIVAARLLRRDSYTAACALLDVAALRTPLISAACLAFVPKLVLNYDTVAADEDDEVSSGLHADDALAFAKRLQGFDIRQGDEPSLVSAYVSAVAAAATALHSVDRVDAQLAAQFCKSLVACMRLFGDNEEVCLETAAALEQIAATEQDRGSPGVLRSLEELLSEELKPHWRYALHPLAMFLERNSAAEENLEAQMVTCLARVVELRNSTDVEDVQRHLDEIFGALLRGGGAQIAIKGAALRDNGGDSRVNNAWLLQRLKDDLRGGQLRTFAEHLLPMHQRLEKRAEKEQADELAVAAKNTAMIATQVWSTLCGFCRSPADFEQQIGGVGALIAKNLSREEEPVVEAALKSLRSLAMSANSAGKKQRFADVVKNVMPLLLKTTQASPIERREEYLSTVTACLNGADKVKLTAGFLRKALKKLLEASSTANNSSDSGHVSLDIALAIAVSDALPPNSAEIELLYRALAPMLADPSDVTLQKKAYKALARLLRSGKLSTPPNLVQTLVDASSAVGPGSKTSRIECIEAGLDGFDEKELDGLTEEELFQTPVQFVVELILLTRDASAKTRDKAYRALLSMCRRFRHVFRHGGLDQEVGLSKFCGLLSAGLAGKSPGMLSATLTVLARIIYEFRAEISLSAPLGNQIDSLFADLDSMEPEPGPITILLRDENRETVRAALGLFKVCSIALKTESLKRMLPAIVPSLLDVSAESKKDLRLRVEVILERLLRKCGREALEAEFPENHKKFLQKIRRRHDRRIRRRSRGEAPAAVGFEDALEGSEDEDAATEAASRTEKTGGGRKSLRSLKTTASARTAPSVAGSRKASTTRTSAKSKRSGLGSELVIKDSGDLLSSKVSTLFTRRELDGRKRGRNDLLDSDSERGDGGGYAVAEDGRPIFNESESDKEEADGQEEAEDDADGALASTSRRSAMSTASKRQQRRNQALKGTNLGEEFKSRRGVGDVKRKGRPDPYAYIPLKPAAFSAGGSKTRQQSLIRKVGGSKGKSVPDKSKRRRLQGGGKR